MAITISTFSSTRLTNAMISVNVITALNTNNGVVRERRGTVPCCSKGRRGLFVMPTAAALVAVADSKTELLDKYLKKSRENKAKNDKERIDSYNKRNYKDYFQLLEGSRKQKDELTESEKGILEWLDKNK